MAVFGASQINFLGSLLSSPPLHILIMSILTSAIFSSQMFFSPIPCFILTTPLFFFHPFFKPQGLHPDRRSAAPFSTCAPAYPHQPLFPIFTQCSTFYAVFALTEKFLRNGSLQPAHLKLQLFQMCFFLRLLLFAVAKHSVPNLCHKFFVFVSNFPLASLSQRFPDAANPQKRMILFLR